MKATGTYCRDVLDTFIERQLKERYVKNYANKFDADVDLIKIKASRQKSTLEQNIADARQDVKKAREKLTTATDRLMELKIQKELNVLEKDLKRKEDQLYLDQMRIDVEAEDEIDRIRGVEGIQFDLNPIFKVEINKVNASEEIWTF